MLKILLKKQFYEIFRSYFYDAKKNRARSKAGVIAYIILFIFVMAIFLGGMFTLISVSLCSVMTSAGVDWLYFAAMGLIAILLGAFGSVFNTYSGLYLSKDNDLLLSMPIPINAIITSRLMGVYLMGLMYSGVVMIPAAIVYLCMAKTSVLSVIGCILIVFLVSLFVMTLSCALGWVVAKISMKLKNKSFITVLISLLFIGGYYFFYFKAQTIMEKISENAVFYSSKIKGAAYPIYLFGRVGTGDPAAMAAVSAVILLLFAVIWLLISRSFIRIATSQGTPASRRALKQGGAVSAGGMQSDTNSSSNKVTGNDKLYRGIKQNSIYMTLLKKEFRRFTSSANYMLNCGLGTLLLPICGIAFIFKGREAFAFLGQEFGETGFLPALICAAVCVLASMNDMAAPSVSLEGKSLWIIRSLPVTSWQALCAKLHLQIIITVPAALICIFCTLFVYSYTPVQLILTWLVSLLYIVFTASFGLFVGLKLPVLNYTNEVTPIKQSLGVAIALFGSFIYAALLFVGFIAIGNRIGFVWYMSAFALLTLALSVLLYIWLKRKGVKIFENL